MSKTKFIYVRSEDTVVLDEHNNPKRDKDGNVIVARGCPVGCFAYKVRTTLKNGKEVSQAIQFGYSVFNPNDKFDRRVARVVAEYRMLFDGNYSVSVPHDKKQIAILIATVGKVKLLSAKFRRACARTASHLLANVNVDVDVDVERNLLKESARLQTVQDERVA